MRIKMSSGLVYDTSQMQRDELEALLKTLRQERIELTNRAKSVRSDRVRSGRLRKVASIKRTQERKLKVLLGHKVRTRPSRRVRRQPRAIRVETRILQMLQKSMQAEVFDKLLAVATREAEKTPMPQLDFRTAQMVAQLKQRVADLESQVHGLPRPPRGPQPRTNRSHKSR